MSYVDGPLILIIKGNTESEISYLHKKNTSMYKKLGICSLESQSLSINYYKVRK